MLSFSEDEPLLKKTGILSAAFPPSWRTPSDWGMIARESELAPLSCTIRGSSVRCVVIYDPRKMAPVSEGDALEFMSLGCVMENMWIVAQGLGIGFHMVSAFGWGLVEDEVKRALEIPESMKIAYAVRLGYPASEPQKYLRVRRDIDGFTYHDRFGDTRF